MTKHDERAEPALLPVDLWDYFAAAALQGMLAKKYSWTPEPWTFANDAADLADAMMAERSKRREKQ